jgi:peptidoglycan/xylan/chitin deacetylase (PgdA/CDA1 family)
MSRHVVCLSFDFDTVAVWIAAGQATPTPLSRGEFGLVGAARVLDLLARHGIRSTWFIPGLTLATYPDACKAVAAAGHEIGHHGWRHIPPASLSRSEEERELVRGNEAIERIAGRPARGYRSPAWDLSPHTIGLLLEHGFRYDSSLMGHDHAPYLARTGDRVDPDRGVEFGPETALIELPISWTLDDYPHFEFGRRQGLLPAEGVLRNWVDDFRYMTQIAERGVLTYTFHPFVIGRGHRMLLLERLILELRELGAEFLAMEEAAAQFAPRREGS